LLLADNGEAGEKEQFRPLVDYFCGAARRRIEQRFHGIHENGDAAGYALARQVLAEKLPGLTTGIVRQKK
jgi:hypothetical protein